MRGLLHLVQQGGDWAGPQPAMQSPPRCAKCNSPPINGQSPYITVTEFSCNLINTETDKQRQEHTWPRTEPSRLSPGEVNMCPMATVRTVFSEVEMLLAMMNLVSSCSLVNNNYRPK